MKRKRNFINIDTLLFILAGVCIAMGVMLAVLRPVYLVPVGIVAIVFIALSAVGAKHLRGILRKALGSESVEELSQSGFATLTLPAVVLLDKKVVWYNDAFKESIAGAVDTISLPASRVIPAMNFAAALEADGYDWRYEDKRYTVYASSLQEDQSLVYLLFAEDTKLKNDAEEYLATRPSVLHISLDTYDNILKLRESEQMRLLGRIDEVLEKYFEKAQGFLRRVSVSRYIAVVEERHMQKMVESRFDILDTVRNMGETVSEATLSIGVGRLGATLSECESMAMQALDMALGRGGDQVAVKSPDGFVFYGGVSRGVEKRERVKSRIISNVIKEQVDASERVLIMGHKKSDMDSLGAAVGMLRFCKMCDKPAAIVLDKEASLAKNMLNTLLQAGYGEDIFSPEDAYPLAGPNTLLIIVDTHMPHLLESSSIYEACQNVVVIDHHRKMVGHIDNAVVLYHEPSASSASELVSELLQYVSATREQKPTPVEADALLAGIMLDTRTFSLNVGVRTFEASAYLRRLGARTDEVKRMFASSIEDYLSRSHLVGEAEIYRYCALVVSEQSGDNVEIVAAQSANDLLTIEGVHASIVALLHKGELRISARSMGEINVQLVMEELGGGGHLTMAGAQLKGVSLKEGKARIMDAIDQYYAQRPQQDEKV